MSSNTCADDVAALRRMIARPKWPLDDENHIPTPVEADDLMAELRAVFLFADFIAATRQGISRALLDEGWEVFHDVNPYRMVSEHFYDPEVMYHRWYRSKEAILAEMKAVGDKAAEMQSSVREYLLRLDAAFAVFAN